MPNAKKQRANKKKAAVAAAATSAAAASKRPPAVKAAASRIDAANATLNLSAGLEAFLSIDLPAAISTSPSTADSVRLDIRSPKTLADGDAQSMYDLLKANMHDMYMEAGWGWDKAEKWREMEHRDARFLIARCGEDPAAADGGDSSADRKDVAATVEKGVDRVGLGDQEGVRTGAASSGVQWEGAGAGAGAGAGRNDVASEAAVRLIADDRKAADGRRLAGYCHFRFAWDQDENEDGEGVGGTEDVLYVYELQVAPWAKRKGLGRRMMQALELLANRHGMTKVMLTVFKENRQAMSFYSKKMKYGIDKDSPSNWFQPDEVYEILSKPTRQGAARTKEAMRAATLLD